MTDFVVFVSAFIIGHLVSQYWKAYNGFGLETMLTMTGFWANPVLKRIRWGSVALQPAEPVRDSAGAEIPFRISIARSCRIAEGRMRFAPTPFRRMNGVGTKAVYRQVPSPLEHKAMVDIRTCEIIEGQLPKKHTKLILAWAELHQDELMANWKLVMNGEAPFKIQPLQ